MTEDFQDNTPTPQHNTRKEVELFPGIMERNRMTPQMVSTRVAAHETRVGAQISMFNPVTFEEALDIVECLRLRASATICLDSMKKSDASRLVDFVAGASAAIDGDFHKLNEHVYLFCPSNMRIIASGKTTPKQTENPLDFLFPDSSVLNKPNYPGYNS